MRIKKASAPRCRLDDFAQVDTRAKSLLGVLQQHATPLQSHGCILLRELSLTLPTETKRTSNRSIWLLEVSFAAGSRPTMFRVQDSRGIVRHLSVLHRLQAFSPCPLFSTPWKPFAAEFVVIESSMHEGRVPQSWDLPSRSSGSRTPGCPPSPCFSSHTSLYSTLSFC